VTKRDQLFALQQAIGQRSWNSLL